jgi:hypothetical protein
MNPPTPGDLVKVANGGAESDGIVFDTPSSSKVVVAIVDPIRGPRFRTVNPNAVTERAEAGPDDRALHLLVRRTPPPVHGPARGPARGGQRRSGYKRDQTHRTTGR